MIWIKKVAATPLNAVAKVIDTLQTQTNERLNAPSIRAVRAGLDDKWKDIYPVGSIYMCVNDINPSTVFGGTWEKIEGKFLLASSSSHENGTTGGAETVSYTPAGTVGGHALTLAETPSHYHKIYMKEEAIAIPTGTGDLYHVMVADSTGDQTGPAWEGGTSYAEGKSHNHGFTGTAATINKMPPFLTVNVWKRTA
jgi:hypothetical protein